MVDISPSNYILVGGFNPSEKYESSGMIIPNIWKRKKCSKPPTSRSLFPWSSGTFPPKKQQHGRRRGRMALLSPLGALRAAEQLRPET